MKKSNLKLVLALLLVTIAGIIVYSCRKSEGPPDPNASIPVQRLLVISALNSFTNDSIGQFSVAITAPSGTINQVATGNTVVIKDPVSGTYVIVVSKTGYNTATAKTINIALPSDAKSSMIVQTSVGLTKVAPAVVITAATGGAIPVKANSEVTTSATIATVTVAPATVFTLADGSKPATVSITSTNVPVNTQLAPMLNIGGVTEVQVSAIEVIKDQIPVKTLDLQPEGMTFDKPMVIDMYIGDLYPSDMPIAIKTLKQDGLTLNYVRKDGTVEVILPDHFSADRNTVYYKITHFSKWNLLDNWLSIRLINTTKSAVQSQSGACGGPLGGTFEYITRYRMNDPSDPYRPWLLTARWADAVYSVKENFSFPGQTGFYVVATWQCTLENWELTDRCPGFWQQWRIRSIVIPQKGEMPKLQYVPCHNQGGHNQGG
ncbi:MAG: hypothetical protein NTZ69_00325 [Bacteroidia bacterium]|nr:hypothetical protein [Bacteroidia bacterium]